MTNATPGLRISPLCPPAAWGRPFRPPLRERVAGLVVGALSAAALATLVWGSAVLAFPTAQPSARLEPMPAEKAVTELPREWRWTPRVVRLDSMYGGRR